MNYQILTTEAEVRELIEWHNLNSEYVVLDIETTGLDSFKDDIIDIQLGGNDERVFIFSGSFAPALEHLVARLVGHNLKFDVTFLVRKGHTFALNWKYHDTMLLAHLENENRDSYSLDALIKEFYGAEASHKEAFWAKYKNYQDAPEEERWEYGANDILFTSRLYRRLNDSLREQGTPPGLVEHVHRLQYSLLRTEIQGIKVDIDYLTNLGVDLKSKIETLRPKMREMVKYEADLVELQLWKKELLKRKTDKGKAGVKRPEFSFESSQQIQALLYDTLELPIQYNEKTRQVSTDYASLEKLRDSHTIVGMIQYNRELQKVYGSYVLGTLERMRDGRIYPEFRVNGTVTGRISHSNPNLGQLPRSGGVRGIYAADEGMVLISADYSQLEVVLEANFTKDPTLCQMLSEGKSKHDATSVGLGIDRNTAKTTNFLLQYRGTHIKLAKVLGIDLHRALDIWTRYWELYAGCKALQAETDAKIDGGEPIVTPFGRKRRFDVRKRKEWDKDYRMGYNFLIQSTGSDCTSTAFYRVSEWLQETGLGRGMFTVHDELIVECKENAWQGVEAKILDTMGKVGREIGLTIPLKAESSGPMKRWQD